MIRHARSIYEKYKSIYNVKSVYIAIAGYTSACD